MKIEAADSAHGLATSGCLVIMLWRGPATRERLSAASMLVRDHAARTGANVGVLSIIEAGAPQPGEAERRELSPDMRALAPSMAAAAFVLEGGGPEAEQTLRVALQIDELRGAPMVQKYCFDAREATAWIVARCSDAGLDTPSRAELLDAIEALRAALSEHG